MTPKTNLTYLDFPFMKNAAVLNGGSHSRGQIELKGKGINRSQQIFGVVVSSKRGTEF